jgi:hypothetical protein
MRSIKRIAAVTLVLSWGASFLAAQPMPVPAVQISLALPAQAVDFGDMDFRDENNQPIAAPQVRRRFEDVVNANLNRLLIENLTPLRRAFLDMLSREKDAFADWIGRSVKRAQRWLWTMANGGARVAAVARRSWPVPAQAAAGRHADKNEFPSLAFLLIASTRLLR